jgi:hypothetical protein
MCSPAETPSMQPHRTAAMAQPCAHTRGLCSPSSTTFSHGGGCPATSAMPGGQRPAGPWRFEDGLLLHGSRLFVPDHDDLRHQVLLLAHSAGHEGVQKTSPAARRFQHCRRSGAGAGLGTLLHYLPAQQDGETTTGGIVAAAGGFDPGVGRHLLLRAFQRWAASPSSSSGRPLLQVRAFYCAWPPLHRYLHRPRLL